MGHGYGPETLIECSSSDQCSNGEVCCATRTTYQQGNQAGDLYESLRCEASCSYPGFVTCKPGVTVCPTLQTQNGPVQLICKASQLLPAGYTVCGFPQ